MVWRAARFKTFDGVSLNCPANTADLADLADFLIFAAPIYLGRGVTQQSSSGDSLRVGEGWGMGGGGGPSCQITLEKQPTRHSRKKEAHQVVQQRVLQM